MRLTDNPVYPELVKHREEMEGVTMRALFEEDAKRFHRFHLELEDELLFDYSKNIVRSSTLALLVRLADEAGVPAAIARMMDGERVNVTEGRAALHVALRNRSDEPIRIDDEDVMPAVNAMLDKMRDLADELALGERMGYTGERITDVVNIGIGGSDLGPQMVAEALRPFWSPGLRAHFVSNIDSTDLTETLKRVQPETTLFIVSSKTFTTQETLANARSARDWLVGALRNHMASDEGFDHEEAVARHFVAVSTNAKAVREFGIDPDNMFELWDWVGGRYSVWSATGLPVACVLGMEQFEEFLAGANEVDEHFRDTPLAENIPVIMALLGVWYANFWDAHAHAVLPYDQYLHRFPAHLQQLDMESNGKGATRNGGTVDYHTGPIVFGEPGTNGQHAFYQLLHQGTRLVPADFIATAASHNPVGDHHRLLFANFLAQSEALMHGRTEDEARGELEQSGRGAREVERLLPHKVFPGNRPSNSILVPRLSPRTLGMLLALYEHKILVQGVVWNVNSFDQWGVELGKELARDIVHELVGEDVAVHHNASTNGLVNAYKKWRPKPSTGPRGD